VSSPLSVFVIDDHEMVRRAMADYIGRAAGFAVTGDGAGDRATLDLVREQHPAVVVIDMEMPSISGAQFIAYLKAEPEAPRVLVCSMHDAATYVSEAFRRGADGYILKRSPLPSLLEALRRVAAGEGYIDPSLHVDVITRIIERERPDAILPTLGGQTALNLAMELHRSGVLDTYGVEMIGANAEAIETAEDRERFKQAMIEDHQKDIAKYEKQSSNGDPQTSALAKETLPTLRKHLETAQGL